MNSESYNIVENNTYKSGVLKRTFDVVMAFVLMVLLSPVFLVIFLSYKLSGCGGVIFSQERIGKGGKPFIIYKFRTMVKNAECDGFPMLEQREDIRLLKHGKWMRGHHLDELPQLWNVLKGDMSFVGYRPERQYFIDKIMKENPDYELLFQTRPGITSVASVKNGYTDTMDKMLKRLDMDLEYMKNSSFMLDLKIIVSTVVNI